MIPEEKNDYTPEDISYISKDANVRHLLRSALDNVISNRLIGCKSTKKIWDAIDMRCQDTKTIKKIGGLYSHKSMSTLTQSLMIQ